MTSPEATASTGDPSVGPNGYPLPAGGLDPRNPQFPTHTGLGYMVKPRGTSAVAEVMDWVDNHGIPRNRTAAPRTEYADTDLEMPRVPELPGVDLVETPEDTVWRHSVMFTLSHSELDPGELKDHLDELSKRGMVDETVVSGMRMEDILLNLRERQMIGDRNRIGTFHVTGRYDESPEAVMTTAIYLANSRKHSATNSVNAPSALEARLRANTQPWSDEQIQTKVNQKKHEESIAIRDRTIDITRTANSLGIPIGQLTSIMYTLMDEGFFGQQWAGARSANPTAPQGKGNVRMPDIPLAELPQNLRAAMDAHVVHFDAGIAERLQQEKQTRQAEVAGERAAVSYATETYRTELAGAFASQTAMAGRRLNKAELDQVTTDTLDKVVRDFLGDTATEEEVDKMKHQVSIEFARSGRRDSGGKRERGESQGQGGRERESYEDKVARLSPAEKQRLIAIDDEVVAEIERERPYWDGTLTGEEQRERYKTVRNEVYARHFPDLDDRKAAEILGIIKALRKSS
ncbi:hypothetical protein KDA23_06820 [Candidatus Saccharibacteria bacterium]|nr:hypothetical protein [Candidatus Saccharibacteria bacterium]